ncbi:hypothetical protein [Roseovarius sp. Pro17]|uniref:hypothetical protein n=1 Tax=Roseovarius sp. Pro17 TaxID=3108175 RepID=UPI002D77F76E|nr:hypothetical protein [Roseovarius sp. Pro17]
MNGAQNTRGGATVGYVAELDAIEAASVIYLRLWSDGPEAQTRVWNDFAAGLGVGGGRRAVQSFEMLCSLCTQYGRRLLVRHAVRCKCLGADESCFANFVAMAAEGKREDAMLIATLLVRADVAPLVVACAADFGRALKRMHLNAPRDITAINMAPTTLH